MAALCPLTRRRARFSMLTMKASYSSLKNHLLRPVLTSFAAIALTLGLAAPAHAAGGNIEKSFTVNPGGRLVMDVDRGSIHMTTGDQKEVKVQVTRHLKGVEGDRAAEIFAAHEVTIAQEGQDVEVRAKFKGDSNKWLKNGKINYQVEYQITLPKKFDLDLKTAAGEITCNDIQGTVKARSQAGTIHFASVQGPFDGETAAGNVEVDRVEGDSILQTAAGHVSVHEARAKLSIKNHGGGITLGKLGGPVTAETAAGPIRVTSAQARVELKSAGGSIDIEDAHDTVIAHTGAGSVTARFSGQPKEDCKLTTSAGGINVKVADKLAFDVDASTSAGQVHTDLPITLADGGEKHREALRGKLNQGSTKLQLHTSAGSVSINKS
jgi:DUF4097 and DUF4098 domain-containing protein YvlB